MEQQLEELVLLLIYLTSWEENLGTKKSPIKVLRSWKGYPFEIIDALVDKDDLRGSFRAKSIMITEQGANRVEQLKKEYLMSPGDSYRNGKPPASQGYHNDNKGGNGDKAFDK